MKDFHIYHASLVLCSNGLCLDVGYTSKKPVLSYVEMVASIDPPKSRLEMRWVQQPNEINFLGMVNKHDFLRVSMMFLWDHPHFLPITLMENDNIVVHGVTCHDYVEHVLIRLNVEIPRWIYQDLVILKGSEIKPTEKPYHISFLKDEYGFFEIVEVLSGRGSIDVHIGDTYYFIISPRVNYCHIMMLSKSGLCILPQNGYHSMIDI